MEHNLGLTWDPVGGLVQIPCIERNAMAASNAITAARKALRAVMGTSCFPRQVIETMRQTGMDMSHRYKTSMGGLAVNVVEYWPKMVERSPGSRRGIRGDVFFIFIVQSVEHWSSGYRYGEKTGGLPQPFAGTNNPLWAAKSLPQGYRIAAAYFCALCALRVPG